MYGAMLGDIIGAPYEFDRSPKRKDFPLFKKTNGRGRLSCRGYRDPLDGKYSIKYRTG